MEVVREILRQVQEKPNLQPDRLSIEGCEDWIVQRHLELMHEARLVDAVISRPLSQDFPIVAVKDLTWAGHDLAASVLNQTVWDQMKRQIKPGELATLPLKMISSVGQKLLEVWVLQQVGLGGS